RHTRFSRDWSSDVCSSDLYLRVTGRRREELIGRNMFEVFPADPATGSDRSVLQLQASFNRVLASGKPDVLALIHYPIPRTTTQRSEERRVGKGWKTRRSPG